MFDVRSFHLLLARYYFYSVYPVIKLLPWLDKTVLFQVFTCPLCLFLGFIFFNIQQLENLMSNNYSIHLEMNNTFESDKCDI